MNLLPMLLVLSVQAAPPDAPRPIAAGVVPSAANDYAGNACVECHRKEGGRLAEIVEEWSGSVHYAENTSCEQCHGGDPTLTADRFTTKDEFKNASHASFSPEFLLLLSQGTVRIGEQPRADTAGSCKVCHQWTTQSRLGDPHGSTALQPCPFERHGAASVSRERSIAHMCASCHPESTEKHLNSPHGIHGAPSCLFCHATASHSIKEATTDIVDPRPSEEQGRCSLCHDEDTVMPGVVHVRETLDKARESLAAADRQFAELEKLNYRNLGLAEMHAHLPDMWEELRQVQHGCNLQEINELAKSIETVQKRIAYDDELVIALDEARQRQTRIAYVVVGLLLAFAGTLLLYRRMAGPGVWDQTVRDPVRQNLTPPCNNKCPAGNDIQGFIAAAAKGDFNAALETLLKTTPLPGVCGRVCPAPCMSACNRGVYDEAINIRDLERYASDHGRARREQVEPRDEHIAVVGSGPAGLSATYHLARLGYQVTLFEQHDELGGVVRGSVPPYRLPPEALDRDIARILEYGVAVRTRHAVDPRELSRLSREYDAVVIAVGLQNLYGLDLGASSDESVRQGVRFLERARKGQADVGGKAVVVIGGGNVAIDVARTAVRLGAAHVHLYCLEARHQMPAHKVEVDEALEEGVSIHNELGPVRVIEDGGRAVGIEFRRCLSVFDERGAFAPTFDDDDRVTVATDVVLLSLGQGKDPSILPKNTPVREGEALPGFPGGPVLVAGDFAANRGTVAGAIGSGRHCAWTLHRAFSGEDLFPQSPPVATPEHIRMHAFPHAPRVEGRVAPVEARRGSFDEVWLGLPKDPAHVSALAEASRCFSCGVCNQCDACTFKCPEGIIIREGKDFFVDSEFCRGCGQCANECPRGVISMTEWQIGERPSCGGGRC